MMKFKFYIQYILRKLFLNIFEIEKPIGKLFLVNILYLFSKIITKVSWVKYANIDYIVTKFGKFHVRPKTFDVICASPDFERPDVALTLKIIDKLSKENRDIVYLDIGADFGLYSILLGNIFRNLKNIRIYGFEPFKESFELFFRNLNENDLADKIKIFNFGLYSSNGIAALKLNDTNPGSNFINGTIDDAALGRTAKINIKKLDNFWGTLNDEGADVLFLKLDIEGAEKQALIGCTNVINSFSDVYVMTEDFVDENIRGYLKDEEFKKVAKVTPYNSFWYRKNVKVP
jgi:FkbM family methyltransferase